MLRNLRFVRALGRVYTNPLGLRARRQNGFYRQRSNWITNLGDCREKRVALNSCLPFTQPRCCSHKSGLWLEEEGQALPSSLLQPLQNTQVWQDSCCPFRAARAWVPLCEFSHNLPAPALCWL